MATSVWTAKFQWWKGIGMEIYFGRYRGTNSKNIQQSSSLRSWFSRLCALSHHFTTNDFPRWKIIINFSSFYHSTSFILRSHKQAHITGKHLPEPSSLYKNKNRCQHLKHVAKHSFRKHNTLKKSEDCAGPDSKHLKRRQGTSPLCSAHQNTKVSLLFQYRTKRLVVMW